MNVFFKYLRNPHYIKSERIQWEIFFKLIVFFYLVLIPVGLLSGLIIEVMNFRETDFDYNILKKIIAGIILGPFIEEILFRFMLRPKYNNLICFFCFSFVMMIISIVRSNNNYLLFFATLSLLSFFLILNKRYVRNAQRVLIKYFVYIFYLSCLIFGLYHITNYYPITFKLLLIVPVIFLPQIITGTVLGFIRLKFGIIYSMLFHAIINIFPIFLIVIS